jgi:hypothetical protein
MPYTIPQNENPRTDADEHFTKRTLTCQPSPTNPASPSTPMSTTKPNLLSGNDSPSWESLQEVAHREKFLTSTKLEWLRFLESLKANDHFALSAPSCLPQSLKKSLPILGVYRDPQGKVHEIVRGYSLAGILDRMLLVQTSEELTLKIHESDYHPNPTSPQGS